MSVIVIMLEIPFFERYRQLIGHAEHFRNTVRRYGSADDNIFLADKPVAVKIAAVRLIC